MGYVASKFRGAIAVGGGRVQLGADVNLYRSAANTLKTDDGLNVPLTSTLTGKITPSAGMDASGGPILAVPYATASPTVDTNGHLSYVQKGNRSYMLYRAGGTPCYMTLPQVTGGTILVTVGGTP